MCVIQCSQPQALVTIRHSEIHPQLKIQFKYPDAPPSPCHLWQWGTTTIPPPPVIHGSGVLQQGEHKRDSKVRIRGRLYVRAKKASSEMYVWSYKTIAACNILESTVVRAPAVSSFGYCQSKRVNKLCVARGLINCNFKHSSAKYISQHVVIILMGLK